MRIKLTRAKTGGLGVVLFVVVTCCGQAAAATTSRYTPGRLIFKLSSEVAREAHASIGRLGGAGAVTGDAVLDSLLGRHRARDMRAPFASRQSRAARLLDRFPRRSARARASAAAPAFDDVFAVDLDPSLDMELVARDYSRVPGVVWAQPERIYEAVFTPDDPYFASSGSWGQPFRDLWGTVKIEAPAAWDITRGAGVVVAVTDTGVDATHPDLAGQMWSNAGEIAGNAIDDDHNGYVDDVNGWDASNFDNDPFDDNGHGTHVAGTIAAAGDNGEGITGVAFEAQIMPLKGLGGGGGGATLGLADIILYAIDNGADVINASWGGTGFDQVLADAVAAAHAAGVVFVAAAGNASMDMADFFPAALPDAIAVAAFDHTDQIAWFSNFGPRIDVGAPGGGDAAPPANTSSSSILSLRANNGGILGYAVGQQYTRLSGTSMAAPHVAGAAALVLSAHPTFSPDQVRQALRASADDVGAAGVDLQSGFGRIDAHQAVLLEDVLDVRITSPAHESAPSGLIEITGTAAGPAFDRYVLDYGSGPLPSAWTSIGGEVTAPVEADVLGTWDLDVVSDGEYTLRLRAHTTSGTWFEDRVHMYVDHVSIISPTAGDVVGSAGEPVEIRGNAGGAGFTEYGVEYRVIGADMSIGPWSTTGMTLAAGGGASVADGLLATFDPTVLAGASDIDIRLSVTSAAGTISEEARHVVVDPTQRAGWPRQIQTYDFPGSVTLADLDGDGAQEIVVVSAERIDAFRADGSELAGWPVSLGTAERFFEVSAAVGDLDGDSAPEVVTRTSLGIDIRHGDGTHMATVEDPIFNGGSPVLADVDADGALDVLYAGGSTRNVVNAVRPDGSALPGFPIVVGCFNWPPQYCLEADIAVGDIDGDGGPEVAVIHNHLDQQNLVAYAEGQVKLASRKCNGRPRTVRKANAPVMADFDGDGALDVACNSEGKKVYAYTGIGKKVSFVPRKLPYYEQRSYRKFGSEQEPIVAGDLNGDGFAEAVLGMSFPNTPLYHGEPAPLPFPYDGYDFLIGLYSRASNVAAYFASVFRYTDAVKIYGPGTPAIGDVDGDGAQDIVVASGTCSGWGGWSDSEVRRCYTVHAFRADGSMLPGFPKPTAQYGFRRNSSPALGDVDGDGLKEIVWIDGSNRVNVWTVPGTPGPSNMEWPMFRGSPTHTGALPVSP